MYPHIMIWLLSQRRIRVCLSQTAFMQSNPNAHTAKLSMGARNLRCGSMRQMHYTYGKVLLPVRQAKLPFSSVQWAFRAARAGPLFYGDRQGPYDRRGPPPGGPGGYGRRYPADDWHPDDRYAAPDDRYGPPDDRYGGGAADDRYGGRGARSPPRNRCMRIVFVKRLCCGSL